MKKTFIRIALFIILPLSVFITELKAGEPCCHIMICCKSCNGGAKFLVNNEWNSSHDYKEINQVRSILQKIKEAGINTVIIDMTNASQWTIFKDGYELGVNNVQQVCNEKDMKFFIFIGGQLTDATKTGCNIPLETDAFQFWNDMAAKIWNTWAQNPAYKRFGYGDDRPMILAFLPSQTYWGQYDVRSAAYKTYLSKFYIGTTQVNEPIVPGATDGWGYRNYSQNTNGEIRFASTNGGVNPRDPWYKIGVDEWRRRVEWASKAEKYSIYGSYDDTCDAIQWGIADTKIVTEIKNKYPGDDPWVYYNILKEIVNPREKTHYNFEFNNAGSGTQGWTGNSNIGTLTQKKALNGSEGVIKSLNGIAGNSPEIKLDSVLTLPSIYKGWGGVEIRIRQLNTGGSTTQAFDPQGTLFEIKHINTLSLADIKTPTWTITNESTGDWIVAKADISSIASNSITNMLVNPIGNTSVLGKNFEIDYIRLTAFLKMEVPSGLTSVSGDGFVSLEWGDNIETDISKYKIYRSTKLGGPFTFLSETKTSSFNDSTVINDVTYYYVTTAVDTKGMETGFSNETSAMPKGIKVIDEYAFKFDFNKTGNIEGWVANGDAGGLVQATSLNGIDGVLKSKAGITAVDPRINYTAGLTLPAGYTSWKGVEIRLRQIGTDGITPQVFDPQGTIYHVYYPDKLSLSEIKPPVWNIVTEPEGNWIVAKGDITLIGNNYITLTFVDPIGNNAGIGKNFELDYVYLTGVIAPSAIAEVRSRDFEIYPNPAKDKITIRSDKYKVHSFKIFDLQGRVVYSSNRFDSFQQNVVVGLEKGIYFVKLEGDTAFNTQKLIIE